jgi:hypothetical protein
MNRTRSTSSFWRLPRLDDVATEDLAEASELVLKRPIELMGIERRA